MSNSNNFTPGHPSLAQKDDQWRLRIPTNLIKEQTLYLPIQVTKNNTNPSPSPTITIPLELLSDPGVARLVSDEYLGSGFEATERNYLLRYLRSGDCLIDIGAHFGLYSIFASSSVKGLNCVALEPHPVNFSVINASIRYSGLQHSVKGLQCAVGDLDGTGELRINSSMGHHLTRAATGGIGVISTPVYRLDKLIERFGIGRAAKHIWLKIDTEGREDLVLSGAGDLLSSGRVRGILWESSVGPLENPANRDIERLLRGFGFSTKKISPHSMFSILAEQDS